MRKRREAKRRVEKMFQDSEDLYSVRFSNTKLSIVFSSWE